MSQNIIDDGYEENPWEDDPPGKLVPVEDFLPPPAAFSNAKTYLIPEAGTLSGDDIKAIEKKAVENGMTPSILVSTILHDYVAGKLVHRAESD